MPSPKNKALYNKVKNEAKRRFKVWPSAYASGWLVKEYKRRGGTYSGKKSSKEGIDRWFKEKWINVCKLPRVVPCGRPKTTLSTWKKKYPYCRPSRRVAGSTPRTSKELSKAEMQRRCKQKRRRPMKRVLGGRKGSRKGSRRGSRRVARRVARRGSRKRSRRRRY